MTEAYAVDDVDEDTIVSQILASEDGAAIVNIALFLVQRNMPASTFIRVIAGLRYSEPEPQRLYRTFVDNCIDGLNAAQSLEVCTVIHCYEISRNISLARTAPKTATPNSQTEEVTLKEEYHNEAKLHLERVEEIVKTQNIRPYVKDLFLDAKATLHLATGNADIAANTFKEILTKRPNHTIALLGKARLLFARRQFRPALKAYQVVLVANPNIYPDPRIGIGLCFWNLGDKELAKKSWSRSLAVNGPEKSRPALIFLGLLHLNSARDQKLTDQDRANEFSTGINYLQNAYKLQFNSSAAIGIARYLERTRNWEKMYKLCERAVRYADSKPILAEAWFLLARAAHGQEKFEEARKFYSQCSSISPDHLSVQIALAQCSVADNEWYPAANAYETILTKNPKCIEALAGLATIRAYLSFISKSANTTAEERKLAKKYYEDLEYELELDPEVHMARKNAISQNADIHIDIGRLWADDDPNRAYKALQKCRKLKDEQGVIIESQILNNLGCLEYYRGNFEVAEGLLGAALTTARDMELGGKTTADSLGATTIAYNLGAVYESKGDRSQAIRTYESMVLARHPEWVEAKARFAALLVLDKDHERAHTLLKEALTSQPGNLELRAMYTYYLYRSNPIKVARDFVLATLREHDRHDVYSLCAAGTLYYAQARENKDKGPDAAKERANKFIRTAEFFEKAVQLDPHCAYAAQGLAICLAEGTLSGKVSQDAAQTAKNAGEALAIFTKVREALDNSSIYICIGHCYFAREDFDRAIEAYETAFRRFYNGKNLQCQLYLARTWYHKGLTNKSYPALKEALLLIREAQKNNPDDVTLQFNLALIQQSCLDVQFDLQPSKRTSTDMKEAREEATEALQIFEVLGKADQSKPLPYNLDVAYHRSVFGKSRLKKAEEQITLQEEYEESETAKIDKIKRERETAEQEKAAAEAARMEEYRIKSEKLAEMRRKMKEDVSSWYVKAAADDTLDEEMKKRAKRKKETEKKVRDEQSESDEDESHHSDEEDPKDPRPKKKRQTNTTGESAPDDEDEIKKAARKGKPGKAYKSAEVIEDSDEE